MRVGILEDDEELGQLLSLWLKQAGYEVFFEPSAASFIQRLRQDKADLVILDWNLPDASGLDVLSWLRAEYGYQIAIVFCTARLEEEDVALALKAGADDYLKKPLSHMETVARLGAIQRRISGSNHPERSEFGPYRLEPSRKKVFLNNEPLSLTHKEFDLAYFLFQNHDCLVRRDQVLAVVWGHRGGDVLTRTVDNHISRLRRKLMTEKTDWRLSAVYQQGYRLESPLL